MRAGKLALFLAASVATSAWAQVTPERAKDTARQADIPRTATASSLQGYALLLQEAESRLRQAKETAARAPGQSQQGAVSNERGELAEAGQAALRSMQNVPAEFAGTEAYRQAERRFRQNLEAFSATQRLDKEHTMAGSEEALRILAELRQQVGLAAEAAGGSIPTPPAAAGGGANR
jgi:hypothetical protein